MVYINRLRSKIEDVPTVVVWTRESLNADDQEQISASVRNRILPVGARPEQPEKPDVSEDPEQSEQPDSPEFPEQPDSPANDDPAKAEVSPSDKTVSSAGVSSPGYPDTGDHNHVIMWIGLAALAVTAAAGLGRIAVKQ